MNHRIRTLLIIPLCMTALVLTTAGFRSCSAEERRSVEQRVVNGLDLSARAVPAGIETVRVLRLAGKVEPATSLKLAQAAVEVNAAAARLTQSALDGADARTLSGQLGVLVELAQGLQRDGTLHIRNEGARLTFDLGIIVAKNGLELALRDLRRESVSFSLDPETREKLLGLRPVFEDNDRLLREAVARLSTSP